MHLRTFSRALAAALALAACESSTGSDPMEGVWLLQSAKGRPLPAAVDTIFRTDRVTYTVDRVVHGSVEFLNADSAVYIFADQSTTYFPDGDSLRASRCVQMAVPYRVQGPRVLLIVEPSLFGLPGTLRLDTLQLGDDRLVQDTRSRRGTSMRLEYAPGGQPAQCFANNP